MISKNKLYKLDAKNKPRMWWIEYDATKYRSCSGHVDGKIVEAGWIFPETKNEGKANQTTVEQQVLQEVESEYTKQLNQGGYHLNIEDIQNGAKHFEPMLATKFENIKDKITYPIGCQPKLDGIRAIATKDGLFSREGKRHVSVPHIEKILCDLFKEYPDLVLDGELYNHDLKNDFEQLVSIIRKTKPTDEDIFKSEQTIQYHVYDIFIKDMKCYDRYLHLNSIFKQFNIAKPIIILQTFVIHSEDEVYEKTSSFIEQGYEGAMVRNISGLYENKRSKNLAKVKKFDDTEFEIVDIIEGVGNWARKAKSVIIKNNNGIVQQSGMRGTFEFAEQILREKHKLIGTDVTVQYQNLTSDGLMRFPIVTKFWKCKRDI